MVYNIDGNEAVEIEDTPRMRFREEIEYAYRRDATTGAVYTMVLIPQKNTSGEIQFPFVLWPNFPNGGNQSALMMNLQKDYLVVINGGRFQVPWGAGVALTGLPCGTVIQNGVVLQ